MTYKFPKITDASTRAIVEDRSILVTLAGSKSYGTDHAGSDTDYRGVLVLPKDRYFSFRKPLEQVAWKEDDVDEEGTIYELRKFIGLALKSNPNIIECLFCAEEHIVFINESGRMLRDNRSIFLSQIAHKSFLGYARSQLNKIKSHKAWLDSPPKAAPTREEFGLPNFRPVSMDQVNAARSFVMRHTNAMVPWLLKADNMHKEAFYEGVIWLVAAMLESEGKEIGEEFGTWVDIENFGQGIVAETLGFDAGFIELLKKEKRYLQAANHWRSYLAWKKGRNRARAELETAYGYDSKHAMHLVRLMKMGEEVLLTGNVNVYRKDREELIDIRNGKWSFEKLVDWSDDKAARLNQIVREGLSVLPEEPDFDKAEELVIELIERG